MTESSLQNLENITASVQGMGEDFRQALQKAAEKWVEAYENVPEACRDFSGKLFHRLVDYATVYSDKMVIFTFRNGAEVSTEI